MPQVMQSLPPVAQAVSAPGVPGGNIETPDSGQSFESALAGQRAADETPAGDVRTENNAKPDAPVAAELAASGNLLPLALPPVPVDPAAGVAAGDLPDFSVTPESLADVLAATPGIPVSTQPPVVLPAMEGRAFSATVELSLNYPAVPNMAARTASAEAQTLAALAAEAVTTAPTIKTPDMAAALEGFRAALKDIAPAAADAHPVLTSLLSASGTPVASSFANALASSPTGAPVPGTSISVPFGHAGWGQAFGNQVVWVVNQGMPAAQLHLSPPDLGPMSVRISMEQDQASIAFSSSHAMVREAIEAALPRLRDMLGSQGITLADVNVSQHSFQHDGRNAADTSGQHSQKDTSALAPAIQNRSTTKVGMVDLYV